MTTHASHPDIFKLGSYCLLLSGIAGQLHLQRSGVLFIGLELVNPLQLPASSGLFIVPGPSLDPTSDAPYVLPELRWKLFCQRVRHRVGDHIHVVLHRIPGLGLVVVASGAQLFDLLDMVPAMCQQHSAHGIERQIRIGLAEENGDLLGVGDHAGTRSVLLLRVDRGQVKF